MQGTGGARWRGGSGQTRPGLLRPGQRQSPPVPRFLPVTGPGGEDTTGTGPENGASARVCEGLAGQGGAGARGRPAPASYAPGSASPRQSLAFCP